MILTLYVKQGIFKLFYESTSFFVSFFFFFFQMERMVSQLKKELHTTKQALKSAQEQLEDFDSFDKLKPIRKETNKENW